MKKLILLVTFLLLSLNIVAQSKKEIIETLKIRIDSLHSEIKNRDINFEKAQALANSNKDALQLTISKLEQDIAFLKGQLDVTQKTNDKLVENNTQLTIRVAELKDSISTLQQNIEAQEAQPIYSDFDRKVIAAFEKIKNDESTNNMFDNISVERDIIKDSYNQICDNGCVSFVLTDQILVLSLNVDGITFMRTYIIDLNTGNDILNENNSYFYVNGFDKEKNILKIDTNGLDNNGRYWKYGTYNLKTKICQFGKKEY
jgi:regulator of replication initiation timing